MEHDSFIDYRPWLVERRAIRRRIGSLSPDFDAGILHLDAVQHRLVRPLRVRNWLRTLEALAVNDILTGRVVAISGRGVRLDFGHGVVGFLRVADMSWGWVANPSDMVNIEDELDVRYLEFDPHTGNVTVGLKQLEANPWPTVHEQYSVGMHVVGRVRRVESFGIVLRLKSGVDGLVPGNEVDWNIPSHRLKMHFRAGDEVEAIVIRIEAEKRRLLLSMKAVRPDPWDEEIPARYYLGALVGGRVTRLLDCGALVELEPGVVGLVHVSKMSLEWVQDPADIVAIGDRVDVRVVSFCREMRRIGLSLIPEPTDDDDRVGPPDDEWTG